MPLAFRKKERPAVRKIEIYDTTLRDGSQAEEISFSVEDKLRITEKLDELGVQYIEGGWPGSNPKDAEYFNKVRKLSLSYSVVAAFGSTYKPKHRVEDDYNIKSLLESKARVVTIVGKTWDFHVKELFKIPLQENLEIIYNSISFLKNNVEKVFFDAEHFFDGYKDNPEFALKCVQAAEAAGADCLVLCDTNGGTLPHDLKKIVLGISKRVKVPLGIHVHNDSDCASPHS
ncbi:MAG TPA: hypothetical protein DCP92_10440 [Nitrospiraceae bacterium]|nr:hypothetical protein [Nitrospiraceae bacterium]